jgi:hypothetical protein
MHQTSTLFIASHLTFASCREQKCGRLSEHLQTHVQSFVKECNGLSVTEIQSGLKFPVWRSRMKRSTEQKKSSNEIAPMSLAMTHNVWL